LTAAIPGYVRKIKPAAGDPAAGSSISDESYVLENAEHDRADKGECDIGRHNAQLADKRTKGHRKPPGVRTPVVPFSTFAFLLSGRFFANVEIKGSLEDISFQRSFGFDICFCALNSSSDLSQMSNPLHRSAITFKLAMRSGAKKSALLSVQRTVAAHNGAPRG
jgi:hypothetical protein